MERPDWIRSVIIAVLSAVLTMLGFNIKPPPVQICDPPAATPKKKTPPPREEEEEDVAPPKPKKPRANTEEETIAAIGRLQMSGGHCSGAFIRPPRPDGRFDILSAAHCVKRVGEKVAFKLRDGRSFPAQVVTFDREVDACWCVTLAKVDDVPSAELLVQTPFPGAKVWHAGFGIDKPGNIERGTVTRGPNGEGQVEFRLSVSPGDSGGAIVDGATNAVISPVCCTSRLGGTGRVFGACPEASTALRKVQAPYYPARLSLASLIGRAPFHRV